MENWIDVNDRLPEVGINVLGTGKREFMGDDEVFKCYVYDLHNEHLLFAVPEAHEDENIEVTHWMPLPKPPVK